MIATLEADHDRASGEAAREVDRVLDRLRARVGEQRLLGEITGGALVEQFAEAHVRFVGADERAEVHELCGLRGYRADDVLGAVSDGEHADAAHEIDEGVAVDVVHERTARMIDDDIGGFREPRGHGR